MKSQILSSAQLRLFPEGELRWEHLSANVQEQLLTALANFLNRHLDLEPIHPTEEQKRERKN
jgi:hypothetical protein